MPSITESMNATALATMTQEKWDRLNERRRAELRDTSGLTKQLVGLEGRRVQVEDMHGNVRRFYVGKSTGWRPCHLEISRINSSGGIPADSDYRSVKLVPGARRRY